MHVCKCVYVRVYLLYVYINAYHVYHNITVMQHVSDLCKQHVYAYIDTLQRNNIFQNLPTKSQLRPEVTTKMVLQSG